MVVKNKERWPSPFLIHPTLPLPTWYLSSLVCHPGRAKRARIRRGAAQLGRITCRRRGDALTAPPQRRNGRDVTHTGAGPHAQKTLTALQNRFLVDSSYRINISSTRFGP